MNALPPDLEDLMRQIDEADRAADALALPLSEEGFAWQPDGGRSWSVAQCLDHLAVINVLYGRAIRGGIEAARARGWGRQGPLALGFFGRTFVKGLEPPVKMRTRSPRSVQPHPRAPREEILRRYHEAHEQVRALVRDAATIDANRATFRNPFLKVLTLRVSTGLHAIAAHDRRHLWQAQRVVGRPGFPG